MIHTPMDVLEQFPVRKSRRHKKVFRESVTEYAGSLGYAVTVEKGSMGARNIIIGDPEKAKYLVTAHYDTPAAMPFPNFITPCNGWVFWGYQILLVLGLLVMAALLGVACGLLIPQFAQYVALAVYWGLLLLLFLGPANRNNSNDNTSGVVTVLQIARDLPDDSRDQVCFVLFDLEEAGLVGSSSYRSAHKKQTDRQVILNMDCVGDGDHIVIFPTKKLKKDNARMAWLDSAVQTLGEKAVSVRKKGFAMYPSDQKNFPYGAGICALNQGKRIGLYLSRIHTKNDTVLDENNISILSNIVISLVAGTEERN